MALSSVEKQIERILELLENCDAEKGILVGQPGVGKTWMARELSDRATERGIFDFILWVFLNTEYDSMALCRSFARQLYLLSTAEECEDDDYEEEEEEEVEMEQDLRQKIHETLAQKRFLLILDDEGKKMNEEQIMLKLETLLNLNQQSSRKVLITTTNYPDKNISEDTMRPVIEVKPLPKEESLSLLRERVGPEVFELTGIEPLVDAYVERSMGLPASIITIAKAFSYFGQHDSAVQKLEIALDKVAHGESIDMELLLRCGYNRLPIGVLIDCCFGGSHFFRDCGSVHYNDLIAYWIMEGYLGQVDSLEKAYEEGYHVLMELIDFGMLKTVETDYVVMVGATINLDDYDHRRGFGGTASLGLANLFRWEGLGRSTLLDGVIRSLCSSNKGGKLSTLLLDENCIGRESPNYLLQSDGNLQVLAVFNPTFESLPQPLYEMDKLNVLVLRGCRFLKKCENIFKLRSLTVLEISCASSLCEIADFFRYMPYLQSLNLSGLQIESLPPSLFTDLNELRWLILRGCSRLKTLKRLNRLKNLEVLDLSGATSLVKMDDGSFGENGKLQVLNLSKTRIKHLPFINSLAKLTHLFLSGCQEFVRLPYIGSLTSLQILDLSESSHFIELQDKSLEGLVSLRILDLSGTAVDCAPSFDGDLGDYSEVLKCVQNPSSLHALDLSKTHVRTLPPLSHLCNLRRLSVSCCLYLRELPDLNSLRKLEVLDVSGCTALDVIQGEYSFEQMSRLQKLDLSETKIARLSSLSNLSNLRHLLLKNCTHLSVVPPLESLSKLEELNLCGISSLTKADFLEHMSHLQILDLSDTLIEQLPSMSNLKDLRELYLRGCLGLKTVPDLEALTKLEVLDLSGTAVSLLPSLENFSNLRRLLLRDCSGLQEFLQPETLDLLGATVTELPYGISKLSLLEHLDLPHAKDNTPRAGSSSSSSKIKESNQHDWGISSVPAEIVGDNYKLPVSVSSSQFLQLLENNPLLWKTSFKQFHFSIHPIEKQDRTGTISFYGDEFMFRDIYFQVRQFCDFVEQRSLEIRGFPHSPKGIEDVLCRSDSLFFIDNAFKRWLSDLGASNLKALKGCWIERCREMESVFHEEEAEEILKLRSLGVLWVSNSVNLKRIYVGNWQSDTFQNLKRLYLDCCPKLGIVFSSSQLPVNLQVLQIKFCDKLEAVFEQASPERKLPYLHTLYLWELPKLKSIGCALPSLRTGKVWGCPRLVDFEGTLQL